MGLKTIATNYLPTSKSAPKVQYWLPALNFDFFSPSSYRIETVFDKAKQWINSLQDIKLHDSLLQFIPVTKGEIPENYNRGDFCGFIPSAQTQPVQPIIIRAQALPEISATPQWFPQERKWRVSFRSSDHSNNTLTKAQREKLTEWFEEQIIFAVTDSLLEAVKFRTLNQMQQNLHNFIQSQRSYCADLETLVTQK
jgi:hypothetical protein